MKILIGLLFILIVIGCNQKPNNILNTAAVHASGAFITEYVHSSLTLRVKGATIIKKEGEDTFHITGHVEGFSSYNVPFSIEHFKEIVHYSGGNINDLKNWECLEIDVGEKRIK